MAMVSQLAEEKGKFLVWLKKCDPLKEYLIHIQSKWQWLVNWLKKKVRK